MADRPVPFQGSHQRSRKGSDGNREGKGTAACVFSRYGRMGM